MTTPHAWPVRRAELPRLGETVWSHEEYLGFCIVTGLTWSPGLAEVRVRTRDGREARLTPAQLERVASGGARA